MGPDTTKEEATSSGSYAIKGLNLPKLAEDGSNWVLYQERVENAIIATKGLRRHLHGTVHKPEPLEQRAEKWYKKGSNTPLTDEQVDMYEDTVDSYEQREAQVREYIYGTVDSSTFIQIKGSTAAEVWKKLTAIHATKGDMFQTDLLNKLQTIRYTEGDDM